MIRGAALVKGIPPWILLGGLGLVLCLAGAVLPLPALMLAAGLTAALLLLRTWPTSGILFLLVAAQAPRFKFEVGPVSVRVEQAAVALVGGLLIWQVLARRRRLWLDVPFLFALVWWVANLLATALNAPDAGDSARHVLRLGMMVATYLAAINLLRTPAQWWTAFRWFLALAVAEMVFGLIARVAYEFGVNIGVQITTVLPIPVPYGTLEEGNMFGSQSAAWLLVFLSLLLALPRERPRLRLAVAAAIGIAALGVLLSFARGAWVALAVGLVLLFVLVRPSRRSQYRRAGLLLIGGPLLLIIAAVIIQSLPATFPLVARLRSFSTALTDQTFGNRLADMIQAVQDWLIHPWLGWGPGTFFQIYGQRWGTDAWIANQTVRTVQETGLLGLLSFWGFLGSVILIGLRALRRTPNTLTRAALLGLGIGFVTLIVAFQATDGTWLAYMWLHAALLVSGARLLAAKQPGPAAFPALIQNAAPSAPSHP